ncbi:hypothetical protein BDZ89DRAFT_1077664 [Hymenopellis radicata]|nr:hypothetical protein BDZ89DRAFT_1077664 [Hymenopellis radicata]
MSSPCEKTLDSRKRPRSPSPLDASSSDQHDNRVEKQHESVQSLASSPATPRDSGQQQCSVEPHMDRTLETRKRPRFPSPPHLTVDSDGEDEVEHPDTPLNSLPHEECLPPSHKRVRSPSPRNSPLHTHQRSKRRRVGLEGAMLVNLHPPDTVRVPKRARSASPQRSIKRRKMESTPKPTQVIYQSQQGVALDVFILVSRLIADKEFSTLFGFYAPEPSSEFYDEPASLPPPRNDPTVPFIVRNKGIVGAWLAQEANLGRLPPSLLFEETHKGITRRMLKEIWQNHMDEEEQYSYKKCILQLLALYNSRNRPEGSKKRGKALKHSDSKIWSRARREKRASAIERLGRAQAQPSTSSAPAHLSDPVVHQEAEAQGSQASSSSHFVLNPPHWQEDDYPRAPPPVHPYRHAHEGAYSYLHPPSHLHYSLPMPYMLPSTVGDHADLNHDPVTSLNREISAGFPSTSPGIGHSTPAASSSYTTGEPYSFSLQTLVPWHPPSSSPSLFWNEADHQFHYDSGARSEPAYTYPQPVTIRHGHWNAPLPTHKAEELEGASQTHAAGVSVIHASLKREDSGGSSGLAYPSPSGEDLSAGSSSIPPQTDVACSPKSGPNSCTAESSTAPDAEGAQLKAESPDMPTPMLGAQPKQEADDGSVAGPSVLHGAYPDFLAGLPRQISGLRSLLKQEEAPLCVNPANLSLSASEGKGKEEEKAREDNSRENSVEMYERYLNLSWGLEDISPDPGARVKPSEGYDGPFPLPPVMEGGRTGDAETSDEYDGPFPLPPFTASGE